MDQWVPFSMPDTQQILLFDIEKDLERFYTDFEAELFDALCGSAPTQRWVLLKSRIDDIFRSTLGPYLFENPACEECPLCTPDKKIDPWAAPKRTRL